MQCQRHYIKQFNSHDEAEKHCLGYKIITHEIDPFVSDCLVRKDNQNDVSITHVIHNEHHEAYMQNQEEEYQNGLIESEKIMAERKRLRENMSDTIICSSMVSPAIEIKVFDASSQNNITCMSNVKLSDEDFTETLEIMSFDCENGDASRHHRIDCDSFAVITPYPFNITISVSSPSGAQK